MSAAVLVTGASGGIGQAISLELSRRSFVVFAHYNSREDAALALQARIRSEGGTCVLLRADLAHPEGVDAVLREIQIALATSPGLEIAGLVNNAAMLLGPSFTGLTSAAFDQFFALNVKAPVMLTRGLLPSMRDGGSIVNISSASAHISSAGNPLNAMSKAALENFAQNLAVEVAPRGIRVNSVVPGYTDNGHAAFRDERALAYMSSLSAMGGVGSPEDVAGAVAFLMSDLSRRMTGGLLDVSGGTSLSPRGIGHTPSVRDIIAAAPAEEAVVPRRTVGAAPMAVGVSVAVGEATVHARTDRAM